jgi:hypothetical protein
MSCMYRCMCMREALGLDRRADAKARGPLLVRLVRFGLGLTFLCMHNFVYFLAREDRGERAGSFRGLGQMLLQYYNYYR